MQLLAFVVVVSALEIGDLISREALSGAGVFGRKQGDALPLPDEADGNKMNLQGDAQTAWFAPEHSGPGRDKQCPDHRKDDRFVTAQSITDKMRVWSAARMGKPRILCGIYTNAGKKGVHDANGDKKGVSRWPLQLSVMQTWGKRCDKVREPSLTL
jgi:hypothetical protein